VHLGVAADEPRTQEVVIVPTTRSPHTASPIPAAGRPVDMRITAAGAHTIPEPSTGITDRTTMTVAQKAAPVRGLSRAGA